MQSKPIFDKRLYKAQAGIMISKQAREVLLRDARKMRRDVDLHVIRSVVCGLKEIHKNFEFVKAALGCAITYEESECDTRHEKTEDEGVMSCYYILSGSVEAFYKVKNGTTSEEECTISYTHVAGDYIGLVSADGARFDLPSPECITTIEQCKFIRIDREVFHDKIRQAQNQFRDEITRYLDNNPMFVKLNEEDRNKLISQMAKQEFPSGKEILSQGKKQEHVFLIAEGRCRYYRRIFLPEQRRSELFNVGYVEKGSYFDPSCILDDQASKFSVVAVGRVTCYLLNKWTVKNSESLLKALSVNRPSFLSDKNIECFIKESDQWQSYKRDIVCNVLVQKQRPSRIVPPDHVPRTLRIAIRHGIALRHRRRQELCYHSQGGLNTYSRGDHQRREATGSGKTKSLLKAIMLMKKSRGSINKDIEKDVKERSVQGVSKEYHNNNEDGFVKNQENHARLITKNMKLKNKRNDSEVENSKTKISTENRVSTKIHSSSDLKGYSSEVTRSSTPRVLEDRWVTNDRRFIVKEVVNTRIPGKSYIEPQAYRRFGPSMFESLDKINTLNNEKTVDPFGAKIAAMTWLKKSKENLAAGHYNPGPTPIIVVEEYNNVSIHPDGETGGESRDIEDKNVKKDIHQGNLESLTEDIENENIVENTNEYEWWTPVHETRYESEHCLEKTKQEIVELEQQLVKLGWSRETLLAKEMQRRKERMKNGKRKEEGKTEKILPAKPEKENKEHKIKNELRKKRTLKRQESIQKILEERVLVRRSRTHHSDGEEQAKPSSFITKHNSTSSLQSTKRFRERELMRSSRTSTTW